MSGLPRPFILFSALGLSLLAAAALLPREAARAGLAAGGPPARTGRRAPEEERPDAALVSRETVFIVSLRSTLVSLRPLDGGSSSLAPTPAAGEVRPQAEGVPVGSSAPEGSRARPGSVAPARAPPSRAA